MSISPASHCGSGRRGDDAIATTVEYVLLTGISVVICLALGMAVDMFLSTTETDATAIAAYGVATTIGTSVSDIAGQGHVSGNRQIDLPERICGMPYLAYPSSEGREIIVSVAGHRYHAPVVLQTCDVKISGLIASVTPEHTIAYDAVSRTVTLS